MVQHRGVFVLGAGGHGKVVISTLHAAGHRVAAVLDDDSARWGKTLLGLPIVGAITELPDSGEAQAVIAVGDNRVRERLARQFRNVEWITAVHPSAYVHPSVHLGPGTVLCAGVVVQPDAVIGAHVIVNTRATVDHDCQVGDYVHLAPGVHLAGGVRVEQGALLGIGSVVIPGCRIGEWTTIGAGGVVVRDLPRRITAIGVPARATTEVLPWAS